MIARDASRDFVAELKSKADIVEVVGSVVALKRAGRSFKGLCPFHGEKTPSFNVDPARQLYKCFGCNKGGDVISFVMEHEHLPFPEAARKLAERFGVEVPEWKPATAEEQARDTRKRSALAALTAAQELFEAALYAKDDEGVRARRYLKGRGLDSTICKAFGIGAAPRDPRALEAALTAKGMGPDALTESGLLKLGEGGAAWAYFRDRITCPIRTASGKLVGFSARLMGPGEPKYLNSPESMLFRKGNNLYGLYEAVKSLREGTPAILVEGNLDVVSLHKAGFTTAVAPLGTALTEEQCRLLEKHTERVILMLDGDAAGHRAALKSLPLLMPRRYDLTVAVLPAGADPDSYVRSEGAEAIQAVLEAAVDPVTFALDEHSRGLDLRDPRFRRRVMDEVRPVVMAARTPVLKQTYYQLVAERLGVDEHAIAEETSESARPAAIRASAPQAAPVAPSVLLKRSERALIAAPFREARHLVALRAAADGELFSTGAAPLVAAVLELSPAAVALDEIADPAVREAVSQIVVSTKDDWIDDAVADGAIATLKRDALLQKARDVERQAKQVEAAGDFRKAAEIQMEMRRLRIAAQQIDTEFQSATGHGPALGN